MRFRAIDVRFVCLLRLSEDDGGDGDGDDEGDEGLERESFV